MAEQAYAYVTLIPVAKGFQREIAKELAGVASVGAKTGISAGDNFKKGFKDAMNKGPSLGTVLTGAFAAVTVGGGLFLKSATDAASSFFAEFEGVNQIFGDAAPTVQAFADQAARLVGVSETAALQAAKGFGVFASAAGLGGQAAATFSVDLVKAAGDLASFNDVPVEETLAAIKSGLQGQGEPLSKYGILMNEASLRNKAFEEGIIATTDQALTPQERVLAANALILSELGVAQNDFVNYSDTYGNSIKTITATFTDLHTEIGLALMPAIENMVIAFSEAFSQIQDPTTDLGESWAELIGTFRAFGETVESEFGKIDLAAILTGILDVVQMLVNGFSQLIYVGGDVGDILSRVFSGDFQGAGQQASTFFTRYNAFVDGLYDSADRAAAMARARARQSAFGPTVDTSTLTGILAASGQGTVATAVTARTAKTTTGTDMTANARKLIKDTRDAFKSARAEYNAELKDIQADFAETQVKIGESFDKSVADATARFNKQTVEITKRYNEQVAEANKSRDIGLETALKEHNKRISSIQDDFAKRQAAIIQQSMDRLRNAYRTAVSINVASIFDSDRIAGSVDGLVQTLRDKLMASRQLVENAALLSSAGFSQTFIEQVVGAGTDVGNELAEAILNSTPETINELRTLYGAIEEQSETGLDDLSQQIYDQTGLATTELRNLYAETEQQLIDSLLVQQQSYEETVAAINASFNEALADAEATRIEAMQSAQDALDESILEAKIKRDEALQDAEESLTKALLKAAQDFDRDLERIEKAFNDKIASMKGAISGLASEIASVNRALNAAQTRVANTITGLTPGLTPFANGGLVTGPTAALIGEAGPEVVIPLDRFESMMGMNQGSVNYYAAPNQSLDSEQELFQAMKRAKVVVG